MYVCAGVYTWHTTHYMSLNVCPLHAVETSRRCTPLGRRCQLHLNLFIVAFMQLPVAIMFATPISSFYLFVTSQPPSSNNTDEIVSGSVDCSKSPSGSLSHTTLTTLTTHTTLTTLTHHPHTCRWIGRAWGNQTPSTPGS